MDVMQKVCELGEAVVQCDAFQRMRQAEDAVAADVEASHLLDAFAQYTQQMQEAMTQDGAADTINRLREKCIETEGKIRANEKLVDLMSAQQDFQALFSQINAVLKYYITGEEASGEGGCGGSCATCGGCGHSHVHDGE